MMDEATLHAVLRAATRDLAEIRQAARAPVAPGTWKCPVCDTIMTRLRGTSAVFVCPRETEHR
jgi:hypothetical protein